MDIFVHIRVVKETRRKLAADTRLGLFFSGWIAPGRMKKCTKGLNEYLKLANHSPRVDFSIGRLRVSGMGTTLRNPSIFIFAGAVPGMTRLIGIQVRPLFRFGARIGLLSGLFL